MIDLLNEFIIAYLLQIICAVILSIILSAFIVGNGMRSITLNQKIISMLTGYQMSERNAIIVLAVLFFFVFAFSAKSIVLILTLIMGYRAYWILDKVDEYNKKS